MSSVMLAMLPPATSTAFPFPAIAWPSFVLAGARASGDGCEPRGVLGQHLAVPDAERLDPALLAEGQRDEEAQLHQLRDAEVLMQLRPQRVVGNVGIPDDRAGVGEGD